MTLSAAHGLARHGLFTKQDGSDPVAITICEAARPFARRNIEYKASDDAWMSRTRLWSVSTARDMAMEDDEWMTCR